MSRGAPEVLYLTLTNAADETSELGVKSEHPLFAATQDWVKAGELAVGDMILNDALLPLTVVAITVDDTPQRVYNLEIGGAHTYFAGDMAAWAHNARRQVSQWFNSRKAARDAACRFTPPIPPGLTRRQLKKLLAGRTPDGPDNFGRDSHFYDCDHNNGNVPNIHYRWGGRR